jgi:hypothetical protein
MWTRETAFQFLEQLEKFLAANGYHCALGGSVMYRSTSDKDLDVIVYPHNRDNCILVDVLWERLREFLSPRKSFNSEGSSRDSKDVRVFYVADRRIDFFFLK